MNSIEGYFQLHVLTLCKKRKEEKCVHTYLVYKIKSRAKKTPAWREIETIGTVCFEKEMRNNIEKKKWESIKNSIMIIFRQHEQEVQPNYKTANLKGDTFPPFISLVIIKMSLKTRICAELNKNYNLVWQFMCS